MKYNRRKFIHVLTCSCGALLLGACMKKEATAPPEADYYTCTMHPSVHSKIPGKCPICGMDLVLVMKKGATSPADAVKAGAVVNEFTVPTERQQQIGVTYATVERKPLRYGTRAAGIVDYDALRHWAFVARVDGYVQQLFVTSPGQRVEKDQPLLSIYSPDLLTAEREFVALLGMREGALSKEARETAENLIASSKVRLKQWNMTDGQIAELEKTKKPSDTISLFSPFRGVVQEVAVHQGVNVKMGDHLVNVADLSGVWVWADFYENELPVLQQGQKIVVTTESYPGEKFEGEIALVNPFLDEVKRTAKVRIDIPNPDFKLHPGMYATVGLEVDMGKGLVIPVSAILPTGTRNIAFVDKGEGKLQPRDVELGREFGDYYEVKSGLSEGERVVASANFLIDAEAKVQGALNDFATPVPEKTGGPQ